MKDIFYELINEAKNGKVRLDAEEWPIKFNTNLEGKILGSNKKTITLVIDDEKIFLDILKRYVEDELKIKRRSISFSEDKRKNQIKSLMAFLFVNMSKEELLHPVDAINRRIQFLNDTTFSLFDEDIDFNLIENSKLKIKQDIQSIYMETPYVIDMAITRDGKSVSLPSISYAIGEEKGNKICYIYAISEGNSLLKSTRENKNLRNRVNKIFNINKKESITEESKSIIHGKDININLAAVFVLSVFLSLLDKHGIHDVKLVPYLPVRSLLQIDMLEKNGSTELLKRKKEKNKIDQIKTMDKLFRTYLLAVYILDQRTKEKD